MLYWRERNAPMAGPLQPASTALLDSLGIIPGVRWYHLADPFSSTLDELAAHFAIHPLQVEDCRHRRQTARVEEHDRYTFVVIKVLASPRGDRRRNPNVAGAAGDHRTATPEGAELHVALSTVPAAALPPLRLRFGDFD